MEDSLGTTLAWLSFVIVIGAWADWFRRMQAVAVPHNRLAWHAAMGVGAALAIGAFVRGTGTGPGIAAGLALFMAVLFGILRLQSAQDRPEPALRVGEPMLAFSAPDETGARFDSASLAGRPYLLKVFRGHW